MIAYFLLFHLQFDCPDDPETYIHRVGRTARFENTGNALMFVEPSEVAIIGHLEAKKIPIQLIEVNPQKVQVQILPFFFFQLFPVSFFFFEIHF